LRISSPTKNKREQHRPERQKVGKCLELACGYGGWVNATKAENIRMDDYFSDDEIKGHIKRWRAESPAIVELWGGQHRGAPWDANRYKEYFGLEGMAVLAVLNPGREYTYHAPHPLARPVTYFMRGDVLYCRLPSSRLLPYHRPRLRPSTHREDELEMTFEGWNTNPKMGPPGWVTMHTYGGKLTENVVQAVSRDILRDAIINLRPAGYPVVLHVHDEIVCERRHGEGSLEELEAVMNVMPAWAAGWPIKAKGGWRGKRYRKD
jgi:DNA polymerase